MRRQPPWVYLIVTSLVLCTIEIVTLLRFGTISFEASERWRALLLFAPFLALFVSIDLGMLAAASNAGAGLDRILKRGIAAIYTILLVAMTVAVAWFIVVPK